MNDSILNLLDAITSGKATDIELSFNTAMSENIKNKMEIKKTGLAKSMFAESSTLTPDDLRVMSHNWNQLAKAGKASPRGSKPDPENEITDDKDIPAGYVRNKKTNVIAKPETPESISKKRDQESDARGYGKGRNMGD